MKALICVTCSDVLAPYNFRNGNKWRVCQCGCSAVRWRDTLAGHLEVSNVESPRSVRVMGMHNGFLMDAVHAHIGDHEAHKRAHNDAINAPGYLFDRTRRECWACIFRPGETNDVFFVDWNEKEIYPQATS